MLLLPFAAPGHAERIILPVDRRAQELVDQGASAAIVINGNSAGIAGTTEGTDAYLSHLHLSLIVHRLVDKGFFSLDDPLHRYIPEIIEENPFKVAVTFRHLLTRTDGFGGGYSLGPIDSPPNRTRPLNPVRTPGQMTNDRGPAPWILTWVLEAATQENIKTIFHQELSKPLGLNDNFVGSITVEHHADILKLLVRNRLPDGSAFLSDQSYQALTEDISWSLHPMAPARTAGITFRHIEGHKVLAAGNWFGVYLDLAFLPDQQVLVATWKNDSRDRVPAMDEIRDIIAERLLPANESPDYETFLSSVAEADLSGR